MTAVKPAARQLPLRVDSNQSSRVPSVRFGPLAPAARPKLAQLRKLGDVTRGEALAGVSEADTERLLKTSQALKANLADACDPPVAGQKRASHG
jgi:hypothetical protein